MPAVQNEYSGTPFLSIVAGKFVKRVEPGTPGSKERVNKLGATVSEVHYDAWKGIVKDWSIVDGEYGKSIHVNFDDVTLSLGGKMMSEFIKKFSGAKADQEIVVAPYDFMTDDAKRKTGLNMIQNGEKLWDFFSDYDKDTKTFSFKNGYPAPPTEWEKMTDAQKKIYYITTEEFLENYVTSHPINNIGAGSENAPQEPRVDPTNPDDVPW